MFDEEKDNVCAYKHISRGDAAGEISKAKHVISRHFETPWTEHAFLEPECAVSYIDQDGDVFDILHRPVRPPDAARMLHGAGDG